jgi:hypothetical protein
MKRAALVALAVVIAAACPNKSKKDPDKPDEPARPPKRAQLGWSTESVSGGNNRVFLAVTDETGSRIVYPIEQQFPGQCTDVGPIDQYKAIIAMTCAQDGTGFQLHAVAMGGDHVVVMRMRVAANQEPDPMARDEILRVKVPLGAKIEKAP